MQVRFGRWNSDVKRLISGQGWDAPQAKPREKLIDRAGYHEVGHLLGYIAANVPVSVDSVAIRRNGAGTVETTPFYSKSVEKLNNTLNKIIAYTAGEMMERLVYGDVMDYGEMEADRKEANKLYQQALEDAQTECLEKRPLIQAFWENREAVTLSHLKQQYSREVVNTLAQRLIRDKQWNHRKINSLRSQYKLGAVPSRQLAFGNAIRSEGIGIRGRLQQ